MTLSRTGSPVTASDSATQGWATLHRFLPCQRSSSRGQFSSHQSRRRSSCFNTNSRIISAGGAVAHIERAKFAQDHLGQRGCPSPSKNLGSVQAIARCSARMLNVLVRSVRNVRCEMPVKDARHHGGRDSCVAGGRPIPSRAAAPDRRWRRAQSDSRYGYCGRPTIRAFRAPDEIPRGAPASNSRHISTKCLELHV
jgi:hypothetical protein